MTEKIKKLIVTIIGSNNALQLARLFHHISLPYLIYRKTRIGRRYQPEYETFNHKISNAKLRDLPFLNRYSVVNDTDTLNELKRVFFTADDVRVGWLGAGIGKTSRKYFEPVLKMCKEHMLMYLSFLTEIPDTFDSQLDILDVGCGVGYMTVCLADTWPQSQVVGVDYDKDVISTAKIFNKLPNIDYFCADFMKYQTNQTFDYIFLIDVLEHIPADLHHLFVKKCLAHLKKDGKLFLATPNAVFEEDSVHSHVGLLNKNRSVAFVKEFKSNFAVESFIVDKKMTSYNPDDFVVESPIETFEAFQSKDQINYTSHFRLVMMNEDQYETKKT